VVSIVLAYEWRHKRGIDHNHIRPHSSLSYHFTPHNLCLFSVGSFIKTLQSAASVLRMYAFDEFGMT